MKTPLTLLALAAACFLAGWLTNDHTRPAQSTAPSPVLPAPPPSTMLVAYTHRPWLRAGSGTNTVSSFLFTDAEWSALTNALPVDEENRVAFPQGLIQRVSQAQFDLLSASSPENVQTNMVWISR